MTSRICVIVRVHDRLEDLAVCVDVIRRCWIRHQVHLVVCFNGASRGLQLPPTVLKSADRCVVLDENAGHIEGNAQLLRAGIPHIPSDCAFTVLLEADTWLFDDLLLERYCGRLEAEAAHWASAAWTDRYHSLALDLAIVRSSTLRELPGLSAFREHAECRVANVLLDHDRRWILIRELMPVHIPASLRRFWNRYGGRFRSFPEGPMVTHHLEDLPRGMIQKKQEANSMLGEAWFADVPPLDWRREARQLRRIRLLARLMPRKAWIASPRRRSFTEDAAGHGPVQQP